MKTSLSTTLLLYLFLFTSCNGQPQIDKVKKSVIVGGGCDGCELMYVGMPSYIDSIDTSPEWTEKGQKLIVTGTVYQLDGITKAKEVIIYYWQTDNDGYYSPRPNMEGAAMRHGHIRGWVKTNADGRYTIKTVRPAPYPNDNLPAHIHLSIKESDIDNEYYTDEIHFANDSLLAPYQQKYSFDNRGGSGIVNVVTKDSLQIVEHNIILGLNIPNYPKKKNSSAVLSGH
jgi:protocatechuate 3,4-dioxygenase beta subunit